MPYEGFSKLKGELASRPGVKNPGALAASIGNKKYGKKAMQHGAKTGHSLRGLQALTKKK